MPHFNPFKIAVSALLFRSSEQRREVRIDVAVAHEPTSTGQKDVVVRLTREDDAQFLYTTRISEDKYGSLCKEQGLGQNWHEFVNFPAMLSGLIEKCANTPEKPDQPKRWMQLTEQPKEVNRQSSLKMEILQTTEVKPVSLLTLSFFAATDAQIKDYLTSRLNSFKQKLSWYEKEKKVQNEKIESLNQKLKSQEADCSERISLLQNEKEEALTKHAELVKERDLLESDLNDKCSECEDLQYEKEQYLKEIDELKNFLLNEKELNQRLQEELENEKSREDESMARLDDELAGLKAELRQKNSLCFNQQKEIGRLVQLVEDLKHDLKVQESETQKGVEIIQKMMKRERAAKSDKVQASNDISSLQDEKLKSVESEREAVKAELAVVRVDLAKLQVENKLLTERCTALSAEKEKLNASVKSKDIALTELYRNSRQPTTMAINPLGSYPSAVPVHNVSPSYRPVLGLQNATVATSSPIGMLHPNSVSPISLRGTLSTPTEPVIKVPPHRENL